MFASVYKNGLGMERVGDFKDLGSILNVDGSLERKVGHGLNKVG